MNEPAWLTHAIDQRMALLEELVKKSSLDHAIIMTPLFEPEPGTDFDRWEHTCDNPGCRRYDPKGSHAGHSVRHLSDGRSVFMGFGVCDRCYLELAGDE